MASTLVHGLDTPPSGTSNQMAKLEARLEEIDAKIEKLEQQIDQKRKERAEIIRLLGATASHLVSKPIIHRLPVEILVKIFQDLPHEQRKRNALLIQVCSRWLDIVSNTAALWTEIELQIGNPMDAKHALVYAMTCLKRTKAMKLAIDLKIFQVNFLQSSFNEMRKTCARFGSQDVKALMDSIPGFDYREAVYQESTPDPALHHAFFLAVIGVLRGQKDCFVDRWSRLSLYFISDPWMKDEISFMWDSLGCTTPNLQHIHITGCQSWDHSRLSVSSLGNLHTLSLSGDMMPGPSFYSRAPLLQRLSLTIDDDYDLTTMSDSLASASFPALQYLHCKAFYGVETGAPPAVIIHLPSLLSLSLQGPGSEYVLRYSDAPVLEHLAIDGTASYHDFSAIPILPSVTCLQWHLSSEDETMSACLSQVVLKLPRLERVYAKYESPKHLAEVGMTIAGLAGEGKTKARLMSEEEAADEPLLASLTW